MPRKQYKNAINNNQDSMSLINSSHSTTVSTEKKQYSWNTIQGIQKSLMKILEMLQEEIKKSLGEVYETWSVKWNKENGSRLATEIESIKKSPTGGKMKNF